MNLKRYMAAAAVLALLLTTACGKNTPPAGEMPPITTERPTGSDPSEQPDPQPPIDYSLLLTTPFLELAETAAEQFAVTEIAGGLRLDRYLGQEKRVRIPEQINGRAVCMLGDDLFLGHAELEVLFVPDSVTAFGTDVLKGCSGLYALRTPLPTKEGTAYLGYLYGAASYEMNNTAELRNLDFLVIGGSPESIPSNMFYDCNDLVAVQLPESVKKLESFSFYRCEALRYLNLESVERLETYAMSYCSSLESISLGNGLQSVGLGALENCYSLKQLSLPFLGESREAEGYLAFVFGASDPAFAADFYPPALREVELKEGTRLAAYAFSGCATLYRVLLPEGLQSIGARAFSGCGALREITLPASLRSLGDNAFFGCSSLTSLTLPEGTEQIGVSCFSHCTALKTVTLPSTLKSLPNGCFAECGALETIALGGVQTVGSQAFRDCSSLSSVTANGKIAVESGNSFLEALLKN